jgi:hypothetical protein
MDIFHEISEKELYDIQEYNPIYTEFQDDENVHKRTNRIRKIIQKKNDNIYHVVLEDGVERDVFIKYTPLLDPVRYMIGRYKPPIIIPSCPQDLDKNDILDNVKSIHNIAYVESMFYMLSNILVDKYKFPHAVTLFDSYLARKKSYMLDITDDLDFVEEYPYFHKQHDKLFHIKDYSTLFEFNDDSRKYKKSIVISDDLCNDEDITVQMFPEYIEKVFEKSSSDEPSVNKDQYFSDLEDDDDFEDDEGDDSDDSDVFASVFDLPVKMICMERLHGTLDEYTESTDISICEWTSIFAQIMFTLITYHKVFDFTHNDLHTNNVMFVQIKNKSIVYKYNDLYYEIPTYNKLYKLIDYGRSIFKYKNKRYCSDSYQPPDGDSCTQYNCEPFLDPTEEVVEPNPSFDLCRLGCSLFDLFLEKDVDMSDSPIFTFVNNLCLDDDDKHVLYNDNKYTEHERYSGFELYTMIARTVHRCEPENLIQHDLFKPFIISETYAKELIDKHNVFVDIDAMECLY